MISIISKFFSRGISLRLWRLSKALRAEFSNIRHEIDEHLQAINENTNEISANYVYISEIESKLDRLSERLDQIQLYLKTNSSLDVQQKNFEIRRLTEREKAVFLVIYTLEDDDGLTYSEIGRKLGISDELVGNYITSMIEKGVPIVKRYINGRPHLRLDAEFKTLQAKENILQVGLEKFF